MAERDDHHQREPATHRGDAIDEPAGVHQEAANGFDLEAAPPEAIAPPLNERPEDLPRQTRPTTGDTMGSPAADPQPIH